MRARARPSDCNPSRKSAGSRIYIIYISIYQYKYRFKWIEIWIGRQTARQINKQTDRQTDRYIDILIDSQIDKHKDIRVYIYVSSPGVDFAAAWFKRHRVGGREFVQVVVPKVRSARGAVVSVPQFNRMVAASGQHAAC